LDDHISYPVIRLFLLPFFLFSVAVFAGINPDSLKKVASESSGTRRIDAMIALAEWYKQRYESRQTEKIYREALEYLGNGVGNDTSLMNRQLTIMLKLSRMLLFENAAYQESTPLLLNALQLAVKLDDTVAQGLACTLLGFNYRFLGKYITASRFLDEAIHWTGLTRDTSRLIAALNEKANVCYYSGDTVASRRLHLEALDLATKTNNRFAENYISHDLAILFMAKKEYRRALDFFLINYQGCKDAGDPRQTVIAALNIADAYQYLGGYDSSFHFLALTDSLTRRYQLNHERVTLYKKLSDHYARQNKFREAFQYITKYQQLNDSIYNIRKERQISELTQQFELNRKDQEHQLLKKQYRVTVIIATLVTVLVFFIIILLLRNLKRRRLINRELEKRNETITRGKDNLEVAFEVLSKKEQQLAEANAAKNMFFSIIAHDLRSPFHALLAFSEILLQSHRKIPDEEREEMIRIVSDSAGSLYKLIENLLEWTRTQTDRIEVKADVFELGSVIDKNIALLEPMAEKKGISMESTVCMECTVYADPGMVDVVVRNLLSNAIKYVHRGGDVTVSAQESSGGVVVCVADTGVGIPADDLKKLFRIDAKIKTPGTENEKGTGLGLTICKEFIEKNEGRIWVDSKEGEGSTFCFWLPAGKKE